MIKNIESYVSIRLGKNIQFAHSLINHLRNRNKLLEIILRWMVLIRSTKKCILKVNFLTSYLFDNETRLNRERITIFAFTVRDDLQELFGTIRQEIECSGGAPVYLPPYRPFLRFN